jgi:His Kinase A (phospho-acceptor) domain/Histidine kinase-, DNA gyrase B-, and HSP90-like ATPase
VDGVEVTRQIVAKDPEVIVLVLAANRDDSLVTQALMAGARGSLPTGAPTAELAEAIIAAVAGQARIAGHLTRPLLDRLVETLGRERETRQAAEEARRTSEHVRREQQFAAVTAHELRTPVTALLGSLATLERLCSPDQLPPQAQELFTACTRQARRLARLVEDLAVAKDTTGTMPVNPTRVEVEQLIDSVVADLDHLGAERVRITAAPELRAWVDPDRLAQVLTNLVRNALQYSPPGSPVDVVTSPGPGIVQIAVHDRGPGIPRTSSRDCSTASASALPARPAASASACGSCASCSPLCTAPSGSSTTPTAAPASGSPSRPRTPDTKVREPALPDLVDRAGRCGLPQQACPAQSEVVAPAPMIDRCDVRQRMFVRDRAPFCNHRLSVCARRRHRSRPARGSGTCRDAVAQRGRVRMSQRSAA